MIASFIEGYFVMNSLKYIFHEAKKLITNNQSTSHKIPYAPEEKEAINQELEQAICESRSKLIFLVGPFGAGKTTQLEAFSAKHKNRRLLIRAFDRVESLDFAYLNLTGILSRLFFLILAMAFTVLITKELPASSALPFTLVLVYFFTKNLPNLMYIFHEAMDSLFRMSDKLVVIENLDHSSLSEDTRWVFLANLWHFRRVYLISLGYPVGDQKEKKKIFERVMELDGTIVEVRKNEQVNYEVIKNLDADFPFLAPHRPDQSELNWLSLFTPGEMLLIRERVLVASAERRLQKRAGSEEKRLLYIQICLEHLLQKLEIKDESVRFDEKTREIRLHSGAELGDEKMQFLKSFVVNIIPDLQVVISHNSNKTG